MDGSILRNIEGHDMAESVAHQPLSADACLWSKASLCGICVGFVVGKTAMQLVRLKHFPFIAAPTIRTHSLIYHSNWRHLYITHLKFNIEKWLARNSFALLAQLCVLQICVCAWQVSETRLICYTRRKCYPICCRIRNWRTICGYESCSDDVVT